MYFLFDNAVSAAYYVFLNVVLSSE